MVNEENKLKKKELQFLHIKTENVILLTITKHCFALLTNWTSVRVPWSTHNAALRFGGTE